MLRNVDDRLTSAWGVSIDDLQTNLLKLSFKRLLIGFSNLISQIYSQGVLWGFRFGNWNLIFFLTRQYNSPNKVHGFVNLHKMQPLWHLFLDKGTPIVLYYCQIIQSVVIKLKLIKMIGCFMLCNWNLCRFLQKCMASLCYINCHCRGHSTRSKRKGLLSFGILIINWN